MKRYFVRHRLDCFFLLMTLVLAALLLDSEKALAQAGTELDSLRAAADSLARTADSLQAEVAGLRAAQAAPAPAATVENPWKMGLGVGYTMNRGNSDQTTLVSSINLSRKGERTRFLNEANMTRSTVDAGPNTEKASLKSKFELEQSDRMFYFTSVDMDRNRQAGLNLRLAPGVGVGLVAIDQERTNLKFNLGVNSITEYRTALPRDTQGHYLFLQEFSTQVNDRTRFDQSLSYKPLFDSLDDYLLNFNLSLDNKLTTNFSLKLSLENKYDSNPPPNIPPYEKQDWLFYAAINYTIW